MLYTSLNEIASFNPCRLGWIAILNGQKKTTADDIKFPIADALESNSISDVCWLLGKLEQRDVLVKFARLCADSVAHLKTRRAAAYAADAAAAAYAAAAYAAAAADAAAAYAAADAAAAAYAAAAAAADADAAADAYVAAINIQREKNKQFLKQCLEEAE